MQATALYGLVQSTTVQYYRTGGFYLKKGENMLQCRLKSAIRPKGPNGAERRNTLRIPLLWGYGIAIAVSIRVALKMMTGWQRARKSGVRSASCAGKGALQGEGGGQFPAPFPRMAE